MTESDVTRLQEIRARFGAIIPGPWRWYGNTASDWVSLATTDRGRLFILSPTTRTTEFVFDHRAVESYALEHAREQAKETWCFAHGESVDPDDPGRCLCEELRGFLAGELDPQEGSREFDAEDRGYRVSLTRGVTVHADLRFPVGHDDRRKEHGGFMHSYREMACYEVLGHCTREEFERRQQLIDVDRPAGAIRPTADEALYREDFIGLDQPEAAFIERAPEDIGWLLERVAELEAEVDRLDEQVREMTL